jgi:nucleoside phosphorylase
MPKVDIGILTIRDDEFRAVLEAFPQEAGAGVHQGANRQYILRHAEVGAGERYTVAILRQEEQGTGEAQHAARDLMEDLAPRLVLVVGIAGGLMSDDVTLGDVVLGTRIHDYTVEVVKSGHEMTYAATGGPIDMAIAAAVVALAGREDELGDWTSGLPPQPTVAWAEEGQLYGPPDWQRELRAKLEHHHGGGTSRRVPIYVSGTIATSDRLVKDPTVLFPWITTTRNLLAVEMESGGVYRAARERCPMLAIRGISDIVGLPRADAWTKFACASAAAFARAFLRTQPVPVGASLDPDPPTILHQRFVARTVVKPGQDGMAPQSMACQPYGVPTLTLSKRAEPLPDSLKADSLKADEPCATAYQPSWVQPRRQSSIHVYVFVPAAQDLVHHEARKALDAPGNPARKVHPVPLRRAPTYKEPLVVRVEFASFEVGTTDPIAWSPPYVRFVVPICAHVGIAPGVHRPLVTVRSGREAGETLATFDFGLVVRVDSPRSILQRVLTGGCVATAVAMLGATVQHALPPAVGWPAGAVCLTTGAIAWIPPRYSMIPAESRDRATVKPAMHGYQKAPSSPPADAKRLVSEQQPIHAIAPDGRGVVSALGGQMLKVGDLENGRALVTPGGHAGRVTACAVTPDGRRAVSTSHDKTLKVWDLESGRVLATLEGHDGWVRACAVMRDGRCVISASGDKTLKVWDMETGRALATMKGHADWVNACAATPDGRRVVSASADKTLKVWDLETGSVLSTLEDHAGGLGACAVTPDGRRVVSPSGDRTLKVWDLESGRVLSTLEGHAGGVNACVVTPDGRRVVSASNDNTLKVWDLATYACLFTHRGDAPYVAVAAGMTGVVAGDSFGGIWFLDWLPSNRRATQFGAGDSEYRQHAAPLSRPTIKKHTILFLAANPTGTSQRALGEEARAIQAEIERSGYRDCFELETRWAAQPLDLLRELRKLKPTVVHFSGHGGPSPAGMGTTSLTPSRGMVADAGPHDHERQRGLFFQGPDGRAQVVTAQALDETFGAAGSSVKLVVLSACYSDVQAEALRAHVDCVVGMSGAIVDDAARNFAIGFYGGLGERESIAVAFHQGRAAISLEGLRDSDQPQLRVRDGVDASKLVLAETR